MLMTSFDITPTQASPSPRRAWIEMFHAPRAVIASARSPSPRRAWIEIDLLFIFLRIVPVALPTEGVD